MHDDDRYTRQRRLREIGDAGQARLERASAVISGDDGAMVELVYLHRAGVGAVTIDALGTPPAFPHAATFRHPAARRHAAGSWRALRTMLGIVGAAGARAESGATS